MPAGARLEFGAFHVVERYIEDAVRVVLGVEAGIGGQPIDGRVEHSACGEAQIEEDPGRLRFRLGSDHAGGRPRGLLAEARAFEHDHVSALTSETPRNRRADYTAADDYDFHCRRSLEPTANF